MHAKHSFILFYSILYAHYYYTSLVYLLKITYIHPSQVLITYVGSHHIQIHTFLRWVGNKTRMQKVENEMNVMLL